MRWRALEVSTSPADQAAAACGVCKLGAARRGALP